MISRFPTRPVPLTPPPAPPPGGQADYELGEPANDVLGPYTKAVVADKSNPAGSLIVQLGEHEDPQLAGIMAELKDILVPVRYERNRTVSKDGLRSMASLLIIDKRSDLKSLVKLDLGNAKQVEQTLDVAFRVAKYWLGSSDKPEALDPRGFYVKGGSQVVFLPGPPRKKEWTEGVVPFLGPAARQRTEGRLTEAEATDNFGRVMFHLIHGIAPGEDLQTIQQVSDRRLAKAWKQVFAAGTKLKDARDTLKSVLSTTPPPGANIRSASPTRNGSRTWLMLVILPLLAAAAVYLALNGFPRFGEHKEKTSDTAPAKTIDEKGGVKQPSPKIAGKSGSPVSSGNATSGAVVPPVPPRDPAKPIPYQTIAFYMAKASAGKSSGTSSPILVEPKLGPPEQSAVLKIPAGHDLWKLDDPEVIAALGTRIKELADAEKVEMRSNGVWVVENARRYVREIEDGLMATVFKGKDKSTGKDVEYAFGDPIELTTSLLTVRYADSGLIGSGQVQLTLAADQVLIAGAQPLWSKVELIPIPDADFNESVVKNMGGVLDLTKPGVKLTVPTIVGLKYRLVATRLDGGGQDVFLDVVMVRHRKTEIEKDLVELFERAKMPKPDDITRFYSDRGNSIYVPHLRELLSVMRAHFNPTPSGSDDWIKKPQDTKSPAYEFLTAPKPSANEPPKK